MPFDDEMPARDLVAVGATPILAPAAVEAAAAGPAPSTGEIIAAEFRRGNTIASAMTSKTFLANNDPDPAYDPWSDIKGSKYEQHWRSFVDANNPAYAARLKLQIDQETEDKRTSAAGGVTGFLSGMAASIFDPTFLLPGGAGVRATAGGFSVLRSSLMAGTAIGAGAAVQELGLQATQETRTLEESAINVGGAVLLGAMLGGGAAALLNRGEVARAEVAMRRMFPDEAGNPQLPVSGDLSAAQRQRLGIEDLTIDGRAARSVAEATSFLNPTLRSNVRASPVAREVAQNLGQNTLYQQANNRGLAVAPGGAAETLADVAYRSRMHQAVSEADQIFSEMRQSGVQASRSGFDESVGLALRNGDTALDGNPYVTRAAETWRARVFEPFKKEAIELGMLPADVSVETATSYFSRVYNRERLIAREPEFRDRVAPYIRQQIEEQFGQSSASTTARIERLRQEVADIRAPAEERAALMGDLEARGRALDEANADAIDRLATIRDLQERARAADEAGDRQGARSLREAATAEREAGGDGLTAYQRERMALRRRRRVLDHNEAGLTERGARLAGTLADIEEAQRTSLERLLRRGQTFEREFQRLNPARFGEERDRLIDAFEKEALRADKAAERAERGIAKLRETGEARISTLKEGAEDEAARLDIATADRMERDAKQQRARAETMARLSERIERLDASDPVTTLTDLRASLGEVIDQVKNITLSRGERAQRLLDRQRKLDPAAVEQRVKTEIARRETAVRDFERAFYDRWEIKFGGEGVELAGRSRPDFSAAAREVVDDVLDKILGRSHGDGAALPGFATPITRGPMKDRTFNIPDALIQDFLVSDVREVADRYARTMAAETALTRRFGSADMRDQIKAIRDDYAALRGQVEAAPTSDQALAAIGRRKGALAQLREWAGTQDVTEITKERALAWLDADMRGAITDVEAVRDLIRGTYRTGSTDTNFARVSSSLRSFNYLRLMGGVVVANLTEVLRPAMVHGLGRYMTEGLAPLIKNLDAVRMSVGEAQLAGVVTERSLQHRLATLAEVGDPYRQGTAIERFLQNATRVASRWNGIALITDMNEAVSSVMTQNRILQGVMGLDPHAGPGHAARRLVGSDDRYLAFLELDSALRERIAGQFKKHGEIRDGVYVANTERWTEGLEGAPLAAAEAEVRAFRAAVNKDISSIVVQRSAGDIPLWGNSSLGKLVLQFRGFTISAHSRVMLRGMQEDQANFVTGIIAMTAVGILASYLQAARGGAERLDKWKQSAGNPGFLIGEGLDRAGIFPLMFEAADTVDKFARLTGSPFNPIKTPLAAAFPGASQQAEGGRYAQRDFMSAIAGPSAGLPTQLARAMGAGFNLAKGDDPKKAQSNAAIGLVPFGSYLGVREMLQVLTNDSPYVGR